MSSFVLATLVTAALAQPLSDPTRPPNVSNAPTGEQVLDSETPRQLQSILFSRNRKVAVINGETVPLGGKVGEAVVAKITESEVVLRYPDRTETLKLLGDIERKPVGKAAVKGAKK
jgi:MSHA biogenesis protein MshK